MKSRKEVVMWVRSRQVVLLLAIVVGALACSDVNPTEHIGKAEQPTIYVPPAEQAAPNQLVGPEIVLNKRREVWEEENPVPGQDDEPLLGWSWFRGYAQQASVALMKVTRIECDTCADAVDPDIVQFSGQLLGDNPTGTEPDPLCADQKFGEQRKEALCSATLIDDSLLLTAGHCLRSDVEISSGAEDPETGNPPVLAGMESIRKYRAVFSYFQAGPGQPPRVSRSQHVFRVKEIAWTAQNAGDISILQLVDENGDPVSAPSGFAPVPLRRLETRVRGNGNIGVIGTPIGIPTKIAATRKISNKPAGTVDIGVIDELSDRFALTLRLDTSSANSGGGIYDLDDMSLVSWVHTGGGFRYSGTCAKPGLSLCNDKNGVFQPGRTISAEQTQLNYFPSDKNRCWREHYAPMRSDDKVDARKWLERFLQPPANVQSIEVGTDSSTVDLLRVVLCPDVPVPQASELRADTRRILENLGFLGGAPQIQIKDIDGIVANSRVCQVRTPSVAEVRFGDPIRPLSGRELTLEGDTNLAEDVVNLRALGASCQDEAGTPDALFAIEIDQPSLIYADAFAPGDLPLDSIIFLMRMPEPGAPVEDWEFLSCNDDSECGDLEVGSSFFSSQFAHPASPGRYVLGVTGFRDLSGPFRLHIQTLPMSSLNRVVEAGLGAGETLVQSVLDQTDLIGATSGQDSPRCQFSPNGVTSSAPDNQFIMFSCPDFTGGPFIAHTLDAQSDFDTVITLRQGNQGRDDGYLCNDDHGEPTLNLVFPGSKLRSLLGTILGLGQQEVELSSGSGVRSYYVDGFAEDSRGQFLLETSFPSAAAFPSGAVQ